MVYHVHEVASSRDDTENRCRQGSTLGQLILTLECLEQEVPERKYVLDVEAGIMEEEPTLCNCSYNFVIRLDSM